MPERDRSSPSVRTIWNVKNHDHKLEVRSTPTEGHINSEIAQKVGSNTGARVQMIEHESVAIGEYNDYV